MLLKAISFLFYLLFAITPFLMSSITSEMFEFNKMIFIYGLSIIITFLWGIYYVFNRPKLKLNLYIYAVIFFVLTQLLSFVFSIDKHSSFYGAYGRFNGGILSLFSFTSLLFVFYQIVSLETVKRILQISLIVASCVVLWGLPAKFGGDLSCLYFTGTLTNDCWTAQFQPALRMFSTLGQPNWLGSYLATHFFIGLMFFIITAHDTKSKSVFIRITSVFKDSNKLYAYFYTVVTIIIFSGILMTASRSTLLSVFMSVIVLLLFFNTEKFKPKLKVIVRLISVLVLIFVTFLSLSFSSTYQNQSVPKNLQITDSYTIRTIVWEGALKLAMKFPFFGTGPETFGTAYYFVKPERHNATSEWDFVYNKAHNEFLHIWATTGIFGIIGYLSIVVFSLRILSSNLASHNVLNKIYSYGFLSSYISLLITNFFGFSTSTVQIMFYLVPIMYLILTSEKSELKIKDRSWNVKKATTIVFLIFITIFLIIQLGRYYLADTLYKRGINAELKDDVITASKFYMKAIELRFEPVYYDKLSGALAQSAFIESFSESKKNYSSLVQASIKAQDIALNSAPKSITFWRTKAKNHYLYFQATKDISDLRKGVDAMVYTAVLAPTDAQSQYMSALFMFALYENTRNLKDLISAKELAKKALYLKPDYTEAEQIYKF
jgi:O-antigen ligase